LLYVTTGLGMGGAETMLLQLASRLHERGHRQRVVSMTGPGTIGRMLQDRGIAVTNLTMQSLTGLASGFMALRQIIARESPVVILGWIYHGYLSALAAQRTCLTRPRLYWGLRATLVTDGRYDRVIAWNARLSGLADAIVANSEAGRWEHIARGFRQQRMTVIPNGIDVDRFRPDPEARATLRAGWGIGEDEPVIVHVARADPMKDHVGFLAAVKAVPQAKAFLVGLGTEQLSLPPNARALGMREDVERLYAAADIVVSSSAYGEGFSNVVAEGMSVGLVPVATDVGDARAILGEVGRIVPPRDPEAMTRALREFADLPRAAREEIGRQARRRIMAEFSIDTAVSRFETLYCNA
jgi:glycosyltransferase involved in cell wall biosynthesis